MSLDYKSSFFLIAGSVIVIIFTVVIVAVLQESVDPEFSQIITVGPVWKGHVWTCTSSSDFLIHSVLRGLGDSEIAIYVSGSGTQSLYSLSPGEMESFSIGGPADHTIKITRTGSVSGFITLQTAPDAEAKCTIK